MTKELLGAKHYHAPVKAGVVIKEGTMVAMEAGFAIPAKKAASLIVLGIARETVDNSSGVDGEKSVLARRGVFGLNTVTGAGSVTLSDIGKQCYIADEITVTSTATGSSVAGKIIKIEDTEVFVEIM